MSDTLVRYPNMSVAAIIEEMTIHVTRGNPSAFKVSIKVNVSRYCVPITMNFLDQCKGSLPNIDPLMPAVEPDVQHVFAIERCPSCASFVVILASVVQYEPV